MKQSIYPGYPTPVRSWSIVALIVVVAIVATLDRGVLSLVIDPIRHDLRISDVQVSLLQGLSFSLFYATAGLALGFWTDRVTRCRLLAFGILLWSCATIAAGLATGFWWMFASRLLVGMGEATLGPCAISLICDLFPPLRRGRPMGLYLTGQAISNGLSVLLTGAILRHLPPELMVMLPGVGHPVALHPWRVAFIVTGLIGVLVAPFIVAIKEPVRQETISQAQLSLGDSLRFLMRRRRALWPLYLGFAGISAGFYSSLAWGAVSITRHYHLQVVQVTGLLGPASIAAGLLGPSLAGLVVDRIMMRSGARGRMRLLIVMPLLMIPTMLCALMPGPVPAILLLAAMLGAYPALATVFFSVLQGTVPNELRGISISLCGLTNAVIGATAGPLLVAMLAQHLFAGAAATADALALTLLVAMTIGSALFILAWRRRSLPVPAIGDAPIMAASRG